MKVDPEITMSAEQIAALPKALVGLPAVEQVRLRATTTGAAVTLSDYRERKRRLILANGDIHRYEKQDGQWKRVKGEDQWCPVCKTFHVDVGERTDAGELTRPCPRLPADDPRNIAENFKIR